MLDMFLSVFGGISRGGRFASVVVTRRIVGVRCSSSMSSRNLFLYEEAVYALNGLQSNAATLQKARAERDVKAFLNLIDTEKHLKTLGIQVSDLDSLNIIHVAGTKGKGSTCAFVESILRKHGYKTGLYSSPHLVYVNERIRINGIPINKDLFTKYFWEVYTPLQQSLKDGEKMPPYFMFLTVMAFYVFLKEKIQAAVVEVGVGGLYDCTNIVKNPLAVAVTSLDFDHVHILGHTLAEIAAQKSGIFKPGVPAFTVCQHQSAMRVLFEKAKEVDCPLYIAPPLNFYEQNYHLSVPDIVQNANATLALQLVATWLKRHSGNYSSDLHHSKTDTCESEQVFIPMASPFSIDSKFKEGLETCVWPGRFQTIEKTNLTVYLDGAHTQQSIKYCIKWFQEANEKQKLKLQSPVLRILLFNCTGERKAENLLVPLSDVNFDLVIFSPNRMSVMKDSSSDQSNFMVDSEKEVQQCIINKEIWCHLMRSLSENEQGMVTQVCYTGLLKGIKATMSKEDSFLMFCCLRNALDWLLHHKNIKHCISCDKSNSFSHLLDKGHHIQLLVTGSLHLVGGVLGLLEPEDSLRSSN